MKPKQPRLEEGLLNALEALGKQIAREMQRSPEEREQHGVQKWQPISKRVEQLSAFFIDLIGSQKIELEPLLILAQSSVKSIKILMQELESGGLGKIRTSYCIDSMQSVKRDAEEALRPQDSNNTLM